MTKSNTLQNMLIVMCFAIYTVAYMGRYSYNTNINLIMSDYGVDHAGAGLVATFFFFGYGVGQFLNGVLCKKYNKHIIFSVALFVSSLINLCAFFHMPFVFFKYLWLINALLQSCFWPLIILIIGQYLDERHMKKAVALVSAAASVGTLLIYLLNSFFVSINSYRLTFLVASLSMIVVAVMWLIIFPIIKTLPINTEKKQMHLTDNQTRTGRFSVVLLCLLCCLQLQ